MMWNNFIKTLLLVALGMVFLPATTFGQINIDIPYALSNELGVEIIPKYPRPNETIFINLVLYTGDLNSADITWYLNGKVVLEGKGETRYSFKTGNAGEENKIDIQIKLLSGVSFSKTFTLNPASVDIVWEADSYVPPFYKGKALHPKQGALRVIAMPEFVKNGNKISAKNLVYKWSNGLDVYQDQSGYGKNVIFFNGSLLGKTENIKVLVTDPINNLSAESFVDIKPVNPEIVFYENSPYYGHIFDLVITDTFDLKTDEVELLSAPYYFTRESIGALTYGWRLNNQLVPDLSGSRTAIFKKPEGELGRSSVSLQITNLNRILQQANENLIMNFND
ncbi:MAG: hypothetical protein A2726_02190 [Candidatus Zambryskibacteria bacterium RIFCSPHIGHO2_01_FULL_35_32]|nr:MAG: hypothetical protein A2726_02190 [Candidatus Zambryskibacteria bacterium RIFCSPHIGHO2_01_FULL_35_32]